MSFGARFAIHLAVVFLHFRLFEFATATLALGRRCQGGLSLARFRHRLIHLCAGFRRHRVFALTPHQNRSRNRQNRYQSQYLFHRKLHSPALAGMIPNHQGHLNSSRHFRNFGK